MIGFFPDPYPDELLYSVLARFQERVHYPSRESLVGELFGTKKAFATIDLPSHLCRLIASLPPGHLYTVDGFINNHTLLPFYSPFCTKERITAIRENMGDGKKLGFHYRIGIVSSRISLPTSLKFCPLCAREDIEQFGEYYWHRLHQVPGVEVCPIHAIFLENSSALTRNRTNNQEFISAGQVIQLISPRPLNLSNPCHLILSEIAHDVVWLLNQRIETNNLESFRSYYLYLLGKGGLLNDNATVRVEPFLSAFGNYYSDEFLRKIQCSFEPDNRNNWLLRLTHYDVRSQHPLHHLLLIHFLGLTVEGFFRLPEVIASSGSSLPSIQAKKLLPSQPAKSPSIARETLESYRQKWLDILVKNPDVGRSLLSKNFSGVYTWLYYNDYSWLKKNLPQLQSGKNSDQPKLDWNSRDVKLKDEVLLCAKRLLNKSEELVRVTIHSIGKDIDKSSLLKRQLHKLPLTAQVLADVVETYEQFAIRRLWWIVERYQQENIRPARWQLIRRAHIKPEMEVIPEVAHAIDLALKSFDAIEV
ncbi:MAG: TnsD family Tn7-like transposition protein [Phormidium sp.]